MAGHPTIRRARRLLALGTFAPLLVYDVHSIVWRARDDGIHSGDVLQLGGFTAIIWLLGLGLYTAIRRRPAAWRHVWQISGYVLLWMFFHPDDGPPYDEKALYWASAVAGALVIAALGLLPARRARVMVLADLSTEIVDSDLVLTFRPRDVMRVSEAAKADDRLRLTVPLTEITGVTTWTTAGTTEWPVLDTGRTVSLPAGELLGVTTPGGRLVVAVEDAARAKRFVEARVARATASVV